MIKFCAGDGGGRPVARYTCLALIAPMAYRYIIPLSRSASCKSAAQVTRSLRTRPPRHERPRRRRVSRENVACMQSDAAPHILWLRPSRQSGISALNEPNPAPTPEVPMPFGTAQPSHGCVRDTDQLLELPLIDITDAAAQKDLVINSYDRAVSCTLVRTLARVQHMTPCRATQRSHGPPDGLLNPGNAWAGLRPHGSARNQLAFPRCGVSCFARSDSTAGSDQTRMTCTTQFEKTM